MKLTEENSRYVVPKKAVDRGWVEEWMAGQTHIREHLEDLSCDGQDATGVHLIPQLGPCRCVPLGGEQEGGSVTAAGQRRPSGGQEKHTDVGEEGSNQGAVSSPFLHKKKKIKSRVKCLESRLFNPFFLDSLRIPK